MDICTKLQIAKKDEAAGILLYNKIKNLMQELEDKEKHEEHIKIIENYIGQEFDHLKGVELMINEMGCKELSPKMEIYIAAKDIYEKANEIEQAARLIEKEKEEEKKGIKIQAIHNLAETLEKCAREIEVLIRL